MECEDDFVAVICSSPPIDNLPLKVINAFRKSKGVAPAIIDSSIVSQRVPNSLNTLFNVQYNSSLILNKRRYKQLKEMGSRKSMDI